ncbi:MAG: sigma 54-dependent Fis family transcriptional regulator, partial [Deltaproteobacteria bacterium]|nr:sigma 54-dependent Fis family transcriptional regulator [Deltaproteobacteria bacterium]
MTEPTETGSGTWVTAPPGAAEALHVRKCRLEVVAGPDAGQVLVAESPAILLGRIGADLLLTDRKVSALHAEIRLTADGYRLRDLGSSNGTFVWGLRIADALIPPGTTIALGDSAVRFVPLPDSVGLPLWKEPRFCGMVGRSAVMRRLFRSVEDLARGDATVLVTGETGSGKELVAEALHQRSARSNGPFVVLDCGAAHGELFEDHLFGHEPGAFTGAVRPRVGVFEAAHHGTLLLDELGDLPLDVQPKLLRAVETRRIHRLGSVRNIDCDVRLVAATHRDLAAEVNRGTFRADLYFRLAVARLRVPPLRERPEDVEPLVHHFLAELSPTGPAPLPAGFLDWARGHSWPGNVRELRNAVERAITFPRGAPSFEDPAPSPGTPAPEPDLDLPFKEAKRRVVDDFDRRYITALLARHGGNISDVARAAGIDRMSVYKLLARLGIRTDRRAPGPRERDD